MTVVFLLYQSLQFLLETCKILVIGAGGLGCDLLKNLVEPRFHCHCVNERALVQAQQIQTGLTGCLTFLCCPSGIVWVPPYPCG